MKNKKEIIKTGIIHFLLTYVVVGSIIFMIIQSKAIKEPENTIIHEIELFDKDYNINITDRKKQALEEGFILNRNYLLSYKGLLIQLVRKGYNTEEALYAANNLNIDFKDNCKRKAINYQLSNNMSEMALRGCLVNDMFTKEEIDYAISFIDF